MEISRKPFFVDPQVQLLEAEEHSFQVNRQQKHFSFFFKGETNSTSWRYLVVFLVTLLLYSKSPQPWMTADTAPSAEFHGNFGRFESHLPIRYHDTVHEVHIPGLPIWLIICPSFGGFLGPQHLGQFEEVNQFNSHHHQHQQPHHQHPPKIYSAPPPTPPTPREIPSRHRVGVFRPWWSHLGQKSRLV